MWDAHSLYGTSSRSICASRAGGTSWPPHSPLRAWRAPRRSRCPGWPQARAHRRPRAVQQRRRRAPARARSRAAADQRADPGQPERERLRHGQLPGRRPRRLDPGQRGATGADQGPTRLRRRWRWRSGSWICTPIRRRRSCRCLVSSGSIASAFDSFDLMRHIADEDNALVKGFLGDHRICRPSTRPCTTTRRPRSPTATRSPQRLSQLRTLAGERSVLLASATTSLSKAEASAAQLAALRAEQAQAAAARPRTGVRDAGRQRNAPFGGGQSSGSGRGCQRAGSSTGSSTGRPAAAGSGSVSGGLTAILDEDRPMRIGRRPARDLTERRSTAACSSSRSRPGRRWVARATPRRPRRRSRSSAPRSCTSVRARANGRSAGPNVSICPPSGRKS